VLQTKIYFDRERVRYVVEDSDGHYGIFDTKEEAIELGRFWRAAFKTSTNQKLYKEITNYEFISEVD
jgi:hypothetical protein